MLAGLVSGVAGERQREVQEVVAKRRDIYLRNAATIEKLLADCIEASRLEKRYEQLVEFLRQRGSDVAPDVVKQAGKAAGGDIFMRLRHHGFLTAEAVAMFKRQIEALRKLK